MTDTPHPISSSILERGRRLVDALREIECEASALLDEITTIPGTGEARVRAEAAFEALARARIEISTMSLIASGQEMQ